MSGSPIERQPPQSRIGNVAAAIALGDWSRPAGEDKAKFGKSDHERSSRNLRLLGRLFDETLIVGGPLEIKGPGRHVADREGPSCALRDIVAALEAASKDRVIMVAAELALFEADWLLALTAWPEADAVVLVDDEGEVPLIAIYRREVCLGIARRRLDSNELSLGEFLAELDAARVTLAALGLGASHSALFVTAEKPHELDCLGDH